MVKLENSKLATYRCVTCETSRPWGSGSETTFPVLNCITCGGPTDHVYIGINYYTATSDVIGAEEKIQSISFARMGFAKAA
jgi:hypothetical protein